MTIISNLLSWTIKTFCDLISTYFPVHVLYCFNLMYPTPASPTFWMYLEHAKNVPNSGTWHFLFLLSRKFFLQTCQCFAPTPLSVCSPVALQVGSSDRSTWNSPEVSPPILLTCFTFSPWHVPFWHEWYKFTYYPSPSLEVNLRFSLFPAKCLMPSLW